MTNLNTAQLNNGACGAEEKSRLAELVLYIAQKSADDPKFGATKLNKILYFADFFSYQKYGRPITGAEYMKLPFGPAPRLMMPVKNQLDEDGDAEEVEMMFHGSRQKRLIAKREADLTKFSGQDIALLDEVMELILSHTATQVSDISHGLAWKIAGEKEAIPYQSAYLSSDRVTDDDRMWADQTIRGIDSHG